MNKRVILLTGTELRHTFFRIYMAQCDGIEVVSAYCESKHCSLETVVENDEHPNAKRLRHLAGRQQTEVDFFNLFCSTTADQSQPVHIKKGEINEQHHVAAITTANPDLIIAYGCSIIRSSLLDTFSGKFVNIHLGLSPYYRGAGTNYWPFVNNELQFVGTTFMHIDAGIDTGKIIHQIRAHMVPGDSIHQVGNRLIKDSVITCASLVKQFERLTEVNLPDQPDAVNRYYRKKDFTEESLIRAYNNVDEGIIANYLQYKDQIDSRFPIVTNPQLST